MQACGALIGAKASRSLRLHGAHRQRQAGDARAGNTAWGCVGVWSGRTCLSGFDSVFSLPILFFSYACSSCFFFQLCCAATARANLGQKQADHITIDLTCIALHAARPKLSGPHPRSSSKLMVLGSRASIAFSNQQPPPQHTGTVCTRPSGPFGTPQLSVIVRRMTHMQAQ